MALLQLGFDSLFFARIDYQDRAKRLKEKTLEVVWQGSLSLGSSSQVSFLMIFFPIHDEICFSPSIELVLCLSNLKPFTTSVSNFIADIHWDIS